MSFLLIFSMSFISFLISLTIIYIVKKKGNKLIDNFDGVQKFHSTPTPRLGGIAIFLTFFISIFLMSENQSLLYIIILSSIPTFSTGLLEDFYRNISPRQRLFGAFLSGMGFVIFSGFYVDKIDIKFIDTILSVYLISFIFTSFAISGIANSINIIDGFNGLASGSLIIMFSAFAAIGWIVDDVFIFNLSIISAAIFFGFLVINFPFGHIFLGDSGAYLGGFLLSVVAIILPSRNPEISAWVSFLICLYPITETVFSIFRKIKRKGHHPSRPDGVHFHMLVYKRLSRKISFKFNADKYRNAITSIILWVLPLISSIMAIVTFDSLFYTMTMIFIIPIIYILIYKKLSLNW